ncbi:hypothetical protein ACFGS1_000322, partial [Escherichia coli]
TDFGGKTSIFSHPVYLFLRKFSLQDSRGGSGYAISYGLGQGATMIAVIWGVFIWREFASAPAGTNKLLLTMFISYIVGIVLIIAANQ